MFVPLRNFGVLNKFHVDIDLRPLITDNQPRELAKNIKLPISIQVWEDISLKAHCEYL